MRHLAWSIHDKRHWSAWTESTLFDKLYEIEQDCDLLCEVCGSIRTPTGAELANAYNEDNLQDSRSDSVQTILEMLEIAILLKIRFIKTLAEIMNENIPDMMTTTKCLEACGS